MASTSLQPAPRSKLAPGLLLVIAGMIATTLAMPQVLGKLPLQHLFKLTLHLHVQESAEFFFLVSLAWWLKPLVALISDAFPILGGRRRAYMIGGAALAAASFAFLAAVPKEFTPLLAVLLVGNAFLVFASVAVNGYMVALAQANAAAGRVAAAQTLTRQLVPLIQAPASSALTVLPLSMLGFACAGILVLLIPAAIFILRDSPEDAVQNLPPGGASARIGAVFTSGAFWAATALIALFYVSPSVSTALFYKQLDVLQMTQDDQMLLGNISSFAGTAAAILYFFICKKLNLRNLLLIGIGGAALANVGYMFYDSIPAAKAIEAFNGFAYTLAEVALIDLAIRSVPKGSEAFGVALLFLPRNIALFFSDSFGTQLTDSLHWSISSVALIGAFVISLAGLAAWFLPQRIVGSKDGEFPPGSAAPQPTFST